MVKVHLIGKHGRWGTIIDNTLKDMVEYVEPNDADWIVISTPTDLHYEQVKHWLLQDKNVFCEKPLTLSLESTKELYDIAEDNGVRLYVDDVFNWRKDLPKHPSKFLWSKEDNRNFIDRFAYHHFYLWLSQKDDLVDIESVDKISEYKFVVTLKSGEQGIFDYGVGNEHMIDDIDISTCEDNPLRMMFYSVLKESMVFDENKIRTLNATKVSEYVRKTIYPKALVVGGGIFGVTSAIALANNGYQVELHEELGDIMSCASDINQYRLHRGYHYPRSMNTAEECLKGLRTFKRKYGDCVVNGNIEHYYGISTEDSKVSGGEYIEFLNDLDLPYKKVEPLPNTDITLRVEEELFDSKSLYWISDDKLWGNGVDVKTNRKSTEDDFNNFDIVVIATYAKINELLDVPIEYQFEVVEKPVVKLPDEYKNKSIVIMDGPFMCLDPLGDRHVLGNVVHAIHETNIGYEPMVSDRLKPYLNRGVIENPPITNIDGFIESGKKYFKDFEKLEHIGSMFTIRTVLKDRDYDDARPTLVRQEGHNIYTIFSGKIDTCVDASNELINRVKEFS